jgi:peptide/nickel transport system ATP-binding protein
MAEHLLEIEDLKGNYRGIFGIVRAVDGVTLTVDSGEVMGLAGESGCGKSTLAQLSSGSPSPLLHYESGKILVDGIDIYKTDPEVFRTEVKCKRMSYVPQASMDSLNPVKRVRDFVLDVVNERTSKKPLILRIRDLSRTRRKALKNRVLKMGGDHFEKLGLDRCVLDRYPHELSGGMKQRVVIGISTLWNPKLLIIDEPTSALDVTTQKRVIESLVNLKKLGIIESMLFISHDITVLGQLCDRCAVMYGGKIVEVNRMGDILNKPEHPYTRMLISSVVSYDPTRMGKGGLKSIPGSPPDLRNPPEGCRFYPRCEMCSDRCKGKDPPLKPVGNGVVACWRHDG